MPMIGETVTRAMADVAIQRITDVAQDLRAVAKSTRASHLSVRSERDIKMVPLTEAQVTQAWNEIAPMLIWRPDDNCGPRAYLAAHAINRLLGTGVTGIDDAVGAAVAVQSRTFRKGIGPGGRYQYHGFPVVKIEGREGLWAMDPRNASGPVPVERIREKLGARAPLQVWSPVQNTNLDFPEGLDLLRRGTRLYDFKMHERFVKRSWEEAVKAGVVLDRT